MEGPKIDSLSAYGFSTGKFRLRIETAFQASFRDAMIARLTRLTQDRRPFARMIDLACGIGDWTLRYMPLAREVVGVDVNPSFLEQAHGLVQREVPPEERARISFVESDIREFKDYRGADLIGLGGCVMFFSDEILDSLFASMVLTMPPHGIIYVRASVGAEGRPREERYSRNGLTYLRPQRDYVDLAKRHRLKVLEATFSPVVLSQARLGRAFGGFVGERMHRRYDATRHLDYCNFVFARDT